MHDTPQWFSQLFRWWANAYFFTSKLDDACIIIQVVSSILPTGLASYSLLDRAR